MVKIDYKKRYNNINEAISDAKEINAFVEELLGVKVKIRFYKKCATPILRGTYNMRTNSISMFMDNCINLSDDIEANRPALLRVIVHEHMHSMQKLTDFEKVAYANDEKYHDVVENENELRTLKFIKTNIKVLSHMMQIPPMNFYLDKLAFIIYRDIFIALKGYRGKAYTVPAEMQKAISIIASDDMLDKISISLSTESLFKRKPNGWEMD